jgi:ABC-type antimicrobial peptide transport system permease subunit
MKDIILTIAGCILIMGLVIGGIAVGEMGAEQRIATASNLEEQTPETMTVTIVSVDPNDPHPSFIYYHDVVDFTYKTYYEEGESPKHIFSYRTADMDEEDEVIEESIPFWNFYLIPEIDSND